MRCPFGGDENQPPSESMNPPQTRLRDIPTLLAGAGGGGGDDTDELNVNGVGERAFVGQDGYFL